MALQVRRQPAGGSEQHVQTTLLSFPFVYGPLHRGAMSSTLSSTETYSLLSLSLACFGVLFNTFWDGSGEPLIASIAFSALAFAFCYALIRWLGNAFIRRGFKGKDLCKHKQTEMYGQPADAVHDSRSRDAVRRPWALCVPWCICSR